MATYASSWPTFRRSGRCTTRSVFSAAPFHWRSDESQLHRDRLERLLDDPTFGATLARSGDLLVGFAYGFTLAPTTTWWSGLTPPPSRAVTIERPGRTFILFDFAVRSPFRGNGVGRRLHDLLLGSRTEQRATLATQPTAVDTKKIYEHWGWHMIGQADGDALATAPLFDIYLRDQIDDLRVSDRRH